MENKTMTIKEVAEVLGVSVELITKKIRELFPGKMENGKKTNLTEIEVTAIKLNIEKNPHLVQPYEVKTDLEKELLIQQAIILQQEKIEQLKTQLFLEQEHIKLLVHDAKTYTMTEIAKESNFKSATELNKKLEEVGVQYKINGTWVLHAKYSGCEYESIKQQELDNGKIIYNRHWTGKGRDFILRLLGKSLEE